MSEIRSICVYCGSGAGLDPAYADAARTLGRALAQAGIRLVYGGGNVGLMGITATAVLEAGGAVTGIIPRFLQEREVMHSGVDDLIVTEDMHERKRLMFERADAFVALPGGIGTLEEVVEMLTWGQLGQHRKPVVFANINGFWEPLKVLLDHMRSDTFIRPGMEIGYKMAAGAEDVLPLILEAARTETPEPAPRPAAELDRL